MEFSGSAADLEIRFRASPDEALGDSVLVLRRSAAFEVFTHGGDPPEILCPTLGSLLATDLPRSPDHELVRNFLAAIWALQHGDFVAEGRSRT